MTQHTDGPTITTDIAIVGSGMGGGTLAYALRNRGAKILIVERGDYLPREPENWSPRELFVAKRYRTTDPFLDGSGKPFRPSIYYVVGGCTKVYGAALPRFRREDFGVLESEDGVSPAWPVGYDELEPYYAEAERLFRVHGTAGSDPIEGARSTPFPYPAVPHEPVIADVADSFERQGLRPFPLPLGIDLREGGTCIRCKTCDGFPCQVLAKSDAEICVTAPALESPNVSMMTGARAVALRTDPTGRRVIGLDIDMDGTRRTVIASTYVVAAGAINSAALLLRSASDTPPERPRELDRAGRAQLHGARQLGADGDPAQGQRNGLPEDPCPERLVLRRIQCPGGHGPRPAPRQAAGRACSRHRCRGRRRGSSPRSRAGASTGT